jgi:hypothetical protein
MRVRLKPQEKERLKNKIESWLRIKKKEFLYKRE